MFYIQVAYKIDGVKDTADKEVDLASFYKKNNEIHSMKILDRPQTTLKFKIHVNMKIDKENKPSQKTIEENRLDHKSSKSIVPEKSSGKSLSKPPLSTYKSTKSIRFQEPTQKQDDKDHDYSINECLNKEKMKSMSSMKHLTSAPALKNFDLGSGKLENQESSKGLQALQRQVQVKSKELLKIQTKYSELESKYKDLNGKFDKVNEKYSELVIEKEKLQAKKNSEASNENQSMKKEKERYQKLQKEYKKVKDHEWELTKQLQAKQAQIKALKGEVKSYHETNKKNELKIKELKEECQHFEDLLLQMQSKNKSNTATSSFSLENTLKPYKERIRLLERQVQDLSEEKDFVEKQLHSNQDQIIQLRQKIKLLNEQHLKAIEEVSNKDYEIDKLNKKVRDLEEDGKGSNIKGKKNTTLDSEEQESHEDSFRKAANKFKSQKILGSTNTPTLAQLKAQNSDLKKRLQLTQKNLENKEALLKKFDSFSKESKKELEQEVENLKKENYKLKQKFEASPTNENQIEGISSKLEMEKMKKELEYKTKSERQLLIDKGQLESRSKILQEDVVKSKESIAKMLNAIHEFGDEGLIEDVTACLV